MKRIIVIFICLTILCGCKDIKNNKVTNESKKVKIKKYNAKKDYYVSYVSYIDHDDYYEFMNQSTVSEIDLNIDEENYSENDNVWFTENDSNETDSFYENTVDIEEHLQEDMEIEKNIENDIQEEILKDEKSDLKDEEMLVTEKVNEVDIDEENVIEIENVTITEENISESEENIKELESGYYSPTGKYLGNSKVKVIDVSYYQGNVNWDMFAKESDCYGVILRLGYYDTLDRKFEDNIKEIKRLNIPYGIYLFSYSTTLKGSNKEATFTNEMINKYELNPTLGIYYDIESWSSKNGASSNQITKQMYDDIIVNYINKVSYYVNNKYKVKVYSGRWYAMNRLGETSKSYVDWVAEYNSTCKYDGNYSMWQYTSKGVVPGINGYVDVSYLY